MASKSKADLVDYEGFAAIAGLSPNSLRTYATDKSKKAALGFPEPVALADGRKKLWRREDAEAWQKRRVEQATPHTSGRPSKGAGMSPPRVRLTPEQTEALQARLKAAKVTTVEAAEIAGVTRGALHYRYIGKSGWKKTELQAIAKRLKVTYRELTRPVDENDARRQRLAAERSQLEAERARLEGRLQEIDAEVRGS